MVCKACRIGGDSLKQSGSTSISEETRQWFREDADRWHAKCKGETHCDCQHWTKASGIQEKYQSDVLSGLEKHV